jgi:pimeloyl-ACP methyl ester carboxylesterase
LPGEVVAVGHSVSGLVLPLVPAARPVGMLVYLNAFVPVPGMSMADQFAAVDEPILLIEGGREIDEQGRSVWVDSVVTSRTLYPELSPEEAAQAFARLRPQAQGSQQEPCPEDAVDTPARAIVSPDDRVLSPRWARRVARERLAGEPIALPGGHFPMLTNPGGLAAVLEEAAAA